MTDRRDQSELLHLLDWYRAMGADAAVGEVAIDWLARGASPPGDGFEWPERDAAPADHVRRSLAAPPVAEQGRSAASETLRPGTTPQQQLQPRPAQPTPAPHNESPVRTRPQTPLAPSEAETEARLIARQAANLDALQAALTAYGGCSLKATASRLCFYRGAASARLMVIGEAPGREDDIEGRPFVGREGQLLDKMLAAIGLSDADVHMTNLVYWRPPGARAPTPQELLSCRPFVERQIELVRPDVVLLLGQATAKELFGITDGIMKIRGKWREVKAGAITVAAMATLSPAYLIKTPAAKKHAWSDLLALKMRLDT